MLRGQIQFVAGVHGMEPHVQRETIVYTYIILLCYMYNDQDLPLKLFDQQ